MNSDAFTGLPVKEAKQQIAQKLTEAGIAKIKVNYKMQDWSFNRQR